MNILEKLNPLLKLELKVNDEPSGLILHLKCPKHLASKEDKAKAFMLHAQMDDIIKKGEVPGEGFINDFYKITSKLVPSESDYVVDAENDGEKVSEEELEEIKKMIDSSSYNYKDQVKFFLIEKGLIQKDSQGESLN